MIYLIIIYCNKFIHLFFHYNQENIFALLALDSNFFLPGIGFVFCSRVGSDSSQSQTGFDLRYCWPVPQRHSVIQNNFWHRIYTVMKHNEKHFFFKSNFIIITLPTPKKNPKKIAVLSVNNWGPKNCYDTVASLTPAAPFPREVTFPAPAFILGKSGVVAVFLI